MTQPNPDTLLHLKKLSSFEPECGAFTRNVVLNQASEVTCPDCIATNRYAELAGRTISAKSAAIVDLITRYGLRFAGFVNTDNYSFLKSPGETTTLLDEVRSMLGPDWKVSISGTGLLTCEAEDYRDRQLSDTGVYSGVFAPEALEHYFGLQCSVSLFEWDVESTEAVHRPRQYPPPCEVDPGDGQ